MGARGSMAINEQPRPFTPSRNEHSAFASFVKDLHGHPLTDEQWDAFDTEQLIGRPVEIVVVHELVNGKTYANIKLIMPDKSDAPLKPSGRFVRIKERDGFGAGPKQAMQPLDEDDPL